MIPPPCERGESASELIGLSTLMEIMPRCPLLRAAAYMPHLNAACEEFEINTPKRLAAFCAQLAHESGELRYFEEIASGEAYEGRKDLGNTQRGDGKRFKGRGPIQLTGRSNYERAGRALDLDLIAAPERAADADVGFRVAGWFWKSKDLNFQADLGRFDQITKRINGGLNGQTQRDAYHRLAKKVLNVA